MRYAGIEGRTRTPRGAGLWRAWLTLLALSGSTWAATEEPVAVETEAYLSEAGDAPLGMMAATAGGGLKGWLSLRLLAWYPSLSGTGNDEGGGDYDVRSDFGLTDNELALVPQLTLDFWIFGFRMDYFNVEFSGEGTIRQDLTFGGVTLPAGENVVSDVRITNFRSLGMLSFVDTDIVRFAGILGFSNYDYEATIVGETSGPAQIDGSLPIPVIGLLIQVRIGDFLLEAEGSGFYVDWSAVEATVIDATLSVAWSFLKVGEVRAGYRYLSIDGSIDDTSLDILLDGFFVSVGVTF